MPNITQSLEIYIIIIIDNTIFNIYQYTLPENFTI